ncbi:MAG: hypothetical protein MJY72_04635 [Bacteroidales bacterium]|nr:hypothetical protein [Bacteroidales bacterium]
MFRFFSIIMLLLSGSVCLAQEPEKTVEIDRQFGQVCLGEYVTAEMVAESFGLPCIYSKEEYHDYSSIVIRTPFEWNDIRWDELIVDYDILEIAEGIQFSLSSRSDIKHIYDSLKEKYTGEYGEGEETLTPGGVDLVSLWSDDVTTIQLTHRIFKDTGRQFVILAAIRH